MEHKTKPFFLIDYFNTKGASKGEKKDNVTTFLWFNMNLSLIYNPSFVILHKWKLVSFIDFVPQSQRWYYIKHNYNNN